MCSLIETTVLSPDAARCDSSVTYKSCCEAGQRVGMWGSCEPACPAPQYFDIATGMCTDCTGNAIPVYDSPGQSSAGRCQDCPPDLTRVLTRTGGECKPCPPGQIVWNLNQPGAPKPPGLVVAPGSLPQSDAASRRPQAQQPAPGSQTQRVAPKSPPEQSGPAVATASPTGPLFAVEAGKCVPCPKNWIPVYHADRTKSSFGHCEECPPGTSTELPVSAMVGSAVLAPQCRPLNCPGGRYDPKDPHTCLQTIKAAPVPPGVGPPCPQGTRLIAGSCVPERQAPTQSSRPGPPCPIGMVPNPRGPGCIPGSAAVGAQPVVPPSDTRAPARPTATPRATTQQSPPPPTTIRPPPRCPQGLRLVNGQCVR